MEPFGLDISQRTDRTHLAVAGEIDMDSAPQLLEAIVLAHETAGTDVTVDLREVTFMDSRGLAAMITAHRQLARDHARLRIVNPCPAVAAVLEITGVRSLFDADLLAAPPRLMG
jgi:anti-sigma B factor antagonist